jgi:transcriptional regulator NrdR family protein
MSPALRRQLADVRRAARGAVRCECGGKMKVLKTSSTPTAIRRRRICRDCGGRCTTLEVVVATLVGAR